MDEKYNSILICAHEKFVAFHLDGIEVAIFDREKKQLKITTKDESKLEKVKDVLTASALLLKI